MDGKGMMTKSRRHVLLLHMCPNHSAIVLAVRSASMHGNENDWKKRCFEKMERKVMVQASSFPD